MESQRTFRSLEAQAGQRTCFELLAPSRGKLTRLVVTQVGGDPQDLTVRIYNAAVACQGSSESSIGEAPEGEPAADPLHYQIGAPFESTEAGLVQHVFDSDDGHYVNMDAGPSSRKHRLYAALDIPGGSGPCTFDITLGILTGPS